jgi:hypothetical protein
LYNLPFSAAGIQAIADAIVVAMIKVFSMLERLKRN